MGAELSVGFTVTGLSDTPPIGLDGAEVGDALILTKPIGSGTLLAAAMAFSARGRDVVWSHPAFANKKMFARNDKEFVCVDLSE